MNEKKLEKQKLKMMTWLPLITQCTQIEESFPNSTSWIEHIILKSKKKCKFLITLENEKPKNWTQNNFRRENRNKIFI